MELVLALNYSGRRELAHAVQGPAEIAKTGDLPSGAALEEAIQRHLYGPDLPDPDLLIRTSGELRLSNFRLWQLAYTEIHVMPVLWPDFRREHLQQAFQAYARRERRFGGLAAVEGWSEIEAVVRRTLDYRRGLTLWGISRKPRSQVICQKATAALSSSLTNR
jgi:hypothetical protein